MDVSSHPFGGWKALELLLGHELRVAARYRNFVTLVMVSSQENKIKVKEVLGTTLRVCDDFFELGNLNAILMPYTTDNEAHKAVDRYKTRYNGKIDLRYSIVSYPQDAPDVAQMFILGEKRLAKAQRGGSGTVLGRNENSQRESVW